uniref:PIN domain-containing protein n=1 Tax=Candidatus Kentrum sp. DK TaxID=2126562 RepID=A0A450S0L6_9GAMM|nr:MAG: hypothetical protein BECKDK2373B_GA0170837_100920 [Candidatus Kentron sp. DK]
MKGYLLDACALIALLNDEPGANRVEALLAARRLGRGTNPNNIAETQQANRLKNRKIPLPLLFG